MSFKAQKRINRGEADMTEDGRTLKRRHLIFYLEVFNEDNDELLGHVVDITTKGIKLTHLQHW